MTYKHLLRINGINLVHEKANIMVKQMTIEFQLTFCKKVNLV